MRSLPKEAGRPACHRPDDVHRSRSVAWRDRRRATDAAHRGPGRDRPCAGRAVEARGEDRSGDCAALREHRPRRERAPARPGGVGTVESGPKGKGMSGDRIHEDDAELVAYLQESGVVPGVEVVVSDVAPFRGVVTLQIGDETAVLGYNVSSEIRLRPA